MLLDCYVLRKFLIPFLYCIIGFISVWLIWDLSSNAPDFVQGHVGLATLVHFYATQIPAVIVLSMPVATLLALLYSLAQMSRSNELISMLCSGRSLYRIFLPFFFIGLFLVAVVTYFNYEQAPQAEAVKEQMKEEIKTGVKKEKSINSHLFRNRVDNRTWYLQSLYVKDQSAQRVQILQQDASGNIIEKWYISTARYNPAIHQWLFHDVNHVLVDPVGNAFKFDHAEDLSIDTWSETPWRIGSSMMKSDLLGVPELRSYLHYNSDLPRARLAPFLTDLNYRWALPWTCFVVIFIAGPLGVVASRRGIMGGIALAVGLFSALLFFGSFFLAIGKGDRCPAWIAAWGPNIIFLLIGIFLLWIKATGRELPKFQWFKKHSSQ